MFPSLNVTQLFLYLALVLLATLAAAAAYAVRNRPAARVEVGSVSKERRSTWTMPPLALLERPRASAGRTFGLGLLWAYLVIAVVMLVVKSVQLAS
jgi:hypothetical protein